MERIQVELAERSYSICIGAELLSNSALFSEQIKPHQKVVIISNDVVAPLYQQALTHTLKEITPHVELLVLPDGEQNKSLAQFERIMTFLLERSYSRDVKIVALGGGVIGDLVGFAAASYHRGVDFIQVPTTLLSQVDSSVGGKTAVNHPLGKNMIGAFYQPKLVVIDTQTLHTLPARELSAGIAEVIKYGIIDDAEFFAWLEVNMPALCALDESVVRQVIQRCCQIKANVVAKDERESGCRALLNLGHTFGHAIEAQMGYGVWLHGEAVAAGMVLAARTAKLLNMVDEQDVARTIALVRLAKLPITIPAEMTFEHFITHMMRDKKVLSGKLRFVLPRGTGAAEVISDVDQTILAQVIERCRTE
ncbi:3-dehydroquinate synthase [Vibrio stylophorae]|uniref:3-dehydroquinate synthase n=1 Tax=Vibrio stylophorae TaxID=659351 RepID=A0ABM8ZWH0_9VIBR|nr:3-dehydroquinate synthase [Vibrio stylophorae]CAH0534589.1 3-dehydroquinate synthase [Vibrio stylophorae]